MVRLGGAASPTYISVFRGLQAHFRRYGIELDWVLYADYDALVEAFVKREIDLAWNAPLAYVKIKRRLQDPCQVVAMRDVDVNFTTHFIAHASSGITTVQDLKGNRVPPPGPALRRCPNRSSGRRRRPGSRARHCQSHGRRRRHSLPRG